MPPRIPQHPNKDNFLNIRHIHHLKYIKKIIKWSYIPGLSTPDSSKDWETKGNNLSTLKIYLAPKDSQRLKKTVYWTVEHIQVSSTTSFSDKSDDAGGGNDDDDGDDDDDDGDDDGDDEGPAWLELGIQCCGLL